MDKHQEFRDAVTEFQVAQRNFELAEPDHVEIAAHRLKAAELRVDAAKRAFKEPIALYRIDPLPVDLQILMGDSEDGFHVVGILVPT